ncbi:tetratricopeptide repeat protein [Nocardia sp. NPDC046473]|uniref:tetratricopeptide repeat protein n=1 Tax=Nocardia sp. NPDC046473 TaxID=3155733 RepID=UPI0033DDC580
MAERLALVIASECVEFPRLGFTGELATGLYATFTTAGHWLPIGDGPVLDPTIAELKRSIKAAFGRADELGATLLIAFIGHGFTTNDDDFYLLAADSTMPLDSDSGFHLVNAIAEQLSNTRSLDGLIVLVDACEAGTGALGAGNRWVRMLEKSAGRMELLVASDDGNAYDGCFSRTLLRTFDTGLPGSGTNLLCADLTPELNSACQQQTPRHLSFNGTQVRHGDQGLWLVPNRSRSRDAVTGRPATGLVDHLVRSVSLTAGVQETLIDIVEASGDRLQALIGPAGAGKSTLMSLLIRPALVETLGALTAEFITAAVFLDVTSTIESVLVELRDQLGARFGAEFAAAQQAVQAELTDRERFSAFEIEIVRPLHRLRTAGRRIRILIDGLDQPDEGCRNSVVAAIATLTTDARLVHVRVIVGIRSGTDVVDHPDIAHARRVHLQPPSAREVLRELTSTASVIPDGLDQAIHELPDDVRGGWLIPRLITEIDWGETRLDGTDLDSLVAKRFHTTRQRPVHADLALPVGALLAAVGVGPTAPLSLIHEALRRLGRPVALPQLRDAIVDLGVLVARGHPGQDRERIGLSHAAFTGSLQQVVCAQWPSALFDAHAALADALDTVTGPDIDVYAHTAAPRHYLASENSARALTFLDAADTKRRPIDNRASWANWLVAFQDSLPPEHPDVLAARDRFARWTGEAGEPFAARAMFAGLVEDCTAMFGRDHPLTLLPRVQLANWHIQTGGAEQGVAMLTELLDLEQDEREKLRIRADLGFGTGQAGDIVGARDQYAAFLPPLERLLGPTHPDVLHSRDQYARWIGEAGDPERARQQLLELVPLCESTLGPEHSTTMWAKNNLASWTAACGDLDGAARLYREALAMREQVSGIEHPFTLMTRRDLARFYAGRGDYTAALDLGADLPAIWVRLYGPQDRGTLDITRYVAEWTTQAENAR